MAPLTPDPHRADTPLLSPLPAGSSSNAVFWDRFARKYAADKIVDMAGYRTTLQRVQAYLSHDQDVLEIGCGTGTTALQLAAFTRTLLATDVSPRMIEIARERHAAEPVPQLRFAVADLDDPPRLAGGFDAVLAFSVLHLVADLDQALTRVVQVLRPGGLLISKTPCVGEMSPLIGRLALPLMRAIGKAPHVLLLDSHELRSTMIRQGLQIVALERHGTRGKDFRVFIVARKPD